LSCEELLVLVVELQHQIAELPASHEALRPEIEQLKRGRKRQATRLPMTTGMCVALKSSYNTQGSTEYARTPVRATK